MSQQDEKKELESALVCRFPELAVMVRILSKWLVSNYRLIPKSSKVSDAVGIDVEKIEKIVYKIIVEKTFKHWWCDDLSKEIVKAISDSNNILYWKEGE